METVNDLSEDFIQRLSRASDLDFPTSPQDMFQQDSLYMDHEDDVEDNEPDDIIIVHMDIREPLLRLQKIVEKKINVNLKGYKFWLQDSQELEPHKNLVDQCVKGEGLVQINVQIQTTNQKINIVDVLKPTEAALAALAAEDADLKVSNELIPVNVRKIRSEATLTNCDGDDEEKPILNWVLDSKFKKEQTRLQIPEDPNEWTVAQVKHWLEWAVKQFDLKDLKIQDWAFSGKDLCELTHEQFRRKLPRDPGNVFWTHLQLLKECKFVSVVHKAAEELRKPKEQRIIRKSLQSVRNQSQSPQSPNNFSTVGSGNNSQVQLWQFLLEILTDREHTEIIQWVGSDGEFKLTEPDRVARLWGEKKNKPAMNYEKLSRALRYYYDGDMISKVSGKRFAYKFDCDLKLLIGYDAAELSALVNERSFDESQYLRQLEMEDEE